MHAPRGHYWGDLWVYEQFLDLGGHPMFVSRPGPRREDALVEFRFKGGRATRFAHVRLTERGRQVRDGTADALHSRHYSRWAGGRHITHERPLRRPDLRRYSE
jgi:hypothetical protein